MTGQTGGVCVVTAQHMPVGTVKWQQRTTKAQSEGQDDRLMSRHDIVILSGPPILRDSQKTMIRWFWGRTRGGGRYSSFADHPSLCKARLTIVQLMSL